MRATLAEMTSDAEKVRMALEYGADNTPALTREPVFVWTNAEAAFARILARLTEAETESEGLREALDRWVHGKATIDELTSIARAALATEDTTSEHCPACGNEFYGAAPVNPAEHPETEGREKR